MLKNKIILGTSLISLFGGYFIYDYTARFHSNYAIMAVIAVMAIALSIFSFSNEGKRFWNFFGDVKKEFKKMFSITQIPTCLLVYVMEYERCGTPVRVVSR